MTLPAGTPDQELGLDVRFQHETPCMTSEVIRQPTMHGPVAAALRLVCLPVVLVVLPVADSASSLWIVGMVGGGGVWGSCGWSE